VAGLEARIVQLRDVPMGASVGYGATFVAQRPTRIAIVALGYADGYVRGFSNRGAALVDAHLARADHPVDVRLGHALEQPHEEVVEPLAGRGVVDPQVQHLRRGRRDGLHGRHGGRHRRGQGTASTRSTFAPYNAPVHD
jgi:hypothetical protein